jgi:hypothetical protein
MTMWIGQALAPAWLVFPLSAIVLLAVAAHVLVLWRSEMPESRRRIRMASALVMMLALPVLALALGGLDPAKDQRTFVLAWMLATGLILIVVVLAGADILNTLRLYRRELKELRELHREMTQRAGDTAAR